jgi:hypothetical protein
MLRILQPLPRARKGSGAGDEVLDRFKALVLLLLHSRRRGVKACTTVGDAMPRRRGVGVGRCSSAEPLQAATPDRE